jgi:MFS family permease
VSPDPVPSKTFRLPSNVLALGWVSFFTDLATEMLYPVMPLFLVGTLGASPGLLGLIDGIAEGISSGLRWFGGALSDRYRRRKPFVFLGYLVSAISKPVMGLAQIAGGWPVFLAARITDRLGKSLRTSARDALIADSTEKEYRGYAFGFHRAMDTCGAIAGPLMTLAILMALTGFWTPFAARWTGGESEIARLPLKTLFLFAALPGLISVLVVAKAVREIPPPSDTAAQGPPPIFQSFPRPFWMLILANAVFSLGNSSDSFLILRSGELGLGFGAIILAYTAYNAIYAATSAPLGGLSDRAGRKPVIAAGWLLYAAVYAGFSLWNSSAAPWVLLAIYGLYSAFTEGVTKALVSDLVPAHQRAGAIGMFYTASGIAQLCASLIAGSLWNVRLFAGHALAPFAIGSGFAILGAVLILCVPAHRRDD